MGASLLAMRPAHSTLQPTDPPLSRAGSLPQEICGGYKSCSYPDPEGPGVSEVSKKAPFGAFCFSCV
ncbi:hypothetical protein CRX69_15365 [Pseudomonas rhizophila]|uniref:Uncharacterized protein n=1 Tax=Pseudomonas rhizophila TaxID=2045200 RepID=A0ABN5JV98_9PSED|nr:hypothetical protein CRX69_15365 [Pseudomonas rhizophila]